MLRRNLLGYSAAAATVIGGTLFAGWWQVDGPGAPNPIGQRPLPLTEMDFQLTDHDGRTVGPDTLSMIWGMMQPTLMSYSLL